ncbi:MAG: hypothetical protein J6Q15_01760, partial [Clostridia bacterium]|nr:hypothetical protein [Clostridia bacterium]
HEITITVGAYIDSQGKLYPGRSYSISLQFAKRLITITSASASKGYDGTALTAKTYTITSGSLATYSGVTDKETVTITGTGTEPGTYNNTISNVVIKHGSTDVTSSYQITKVNGTLTIGSDKNMFVVYTNKYLTYTGADQTLVNVVPKYSNAGTVYYGTQVINSSNYTNASIAYTSPIKRRDVGTYTVYYYVPGNSQWKELAGSATVTINPATFNAPTNVTLLNTGVVEWSAVSPIGGTVKYLVELLNGAGTVVTGVETTATTYNFVNKMLSVATDYRVRVKAMAQLSGMTTVVNESEYALSNIESSYAITFKANNSELGYLNINEIIVLSSWEFGSPVNASDNMSSSITVSKHDNSTITITASAHTYPGYDITFNSWEGLLTCFAATSTVIANFNDKEIAQYTVSFESKMLNTSTPVSGPSKWQTSNYPAPATYSVKNSNGVISLVFDTEALEYGCWTNSGSVFGAYMFFGIKVTKDKTYTLSYDFRGGGVLIDRIGLELGSSNVGYPM